MQTQRPSEANAKHYIAARNRLERVLAAQAAPFIVAMMAKHLLMRYYGSRWGIVWDVFLDGWNNRLNALRMLPLKGWYHYAVFRGVVVKRKNGFHTVTCTGDCAKELEDCTERLEPRWLLRIAGLE